ncbi:MAG: IclR family transcriptional regulator [Pseudomonadota bacterium]
MNKPVRSDGTVGKALDVLDLVADAGRPLRFSEILARSDQPKATLYRLLRTLTSQRMLAQDAETGSYGPGLRLVRLAHAAWRQASLAPLARPFLDDLAAQVGETVHLAQMDAGQVLYVDKRRARDPVEMFSSAGKIGPGYCTGVGKAIMAHMTDADRDRALAHQAFFAHTPATLTTAEALRAELRAVARDGVAYDRQEHEPGIICIAAPILAGARVIGAVSVTSTTERHSLDTLAALKTTLTGTAGRIGAAAVDWHFPT